MFEYGRHKVIEAIFGACYVAMNKRSATPYVSCELVCWGLRVGGCRLGWLLRGIPDLTKIIINGFSRMLKMRSACDRVRQKIVDSPDLMAALQRVENVEKEGRCSAACRHMLLFAD